MKDNAMDFWIRYKDVDGVLYVEKLVGLETGEDAQGKPYFFVNGHFVNGHTFDHIDEQLAIYDPKLINTY